MVGLHQDFGVGIDIRFQQDALVVIIAEKIPDSELCRQMVSRGVRSLGPIDGMVFTRGEPADNKRLRNKINNDQGTEFLAGS